MRRVVMSFAVACVLASRASFCLAQVWFGGSPDMTGALLQHQLVMSNRRFANKAALAETQTTQSKTPSATLLDSRSLLSPARTPERLAEKYPDGVRAEARRVFAEMLSSYARIAQQFSVPKNDVAGAVAAFLAGNYMAYRDSDFPDENFKPLVNQMRQVIGANPDFQKASTAEKQELYEQMAILGMYMATTQMALKERPNAQTSASMKQAAKSYLEQFLGTDADKVEISSQGLVIR